MLVYGDRPFRLPEGIAGAAITPLEQPPRPEGSARLHNVADEVADLVETASHAARIEARGATLDEAQSRAAEALDAVAALFAADGAAEGSTGSLAAVDLFCLDARPLVSASARLRSADLSSRVLIGIHQREDDHLDLETYGLRKLGQRELHVPDVLADTLDTVGTFLNDVFAYLLRTGRTLSPGDALALGWVDVRAVAAEAIDALPDEPHACSPPFVRASVAEPEALPGMLVLCEPEDDRDEATLVAGVRRAAHIAAALNENARRCGLAQGAAVPRGAQTAVASRRVVEGSAAQLRRAETDDPDASGWVALAEGEEPSEDPDDYHVVPLTTLVAWLPRAFDLLALPPGTGLRLGADGTVTIQLPDEE